MDFGLVLQTTPPSARVVDLAKRAETYGFTHVWTFDSHILWQEPYVIYSQILAETRNVIVGPMVTNPATRDWTVTASVFATLNEMYGNRTVCGIGRGDSAVRVTNGKPTTIDTLRESVHVIRELANGRSVDYKGSTITFPWAARSELEVWVAGYGPRALALAGEVGDGFILQLADPQIVAWTIGAVREAAERAGRDPDGVTICVAAPAYVGDDRRRHMRDQCRWFGGMVGNHVADIVGRYGDVLRRAGRADRVHQGPPGLRLQRARPGRQRPRRLRARRDRRPLLHPRPGRRAAAPAARAARSSASTSSPSTSSTTARTPPCRRTASTSSRPSRPSPGQVMTRSHPVFGAIGVRGAGLPHHTLRSVPAGPDDPQGPAVRPRAGARRRGVGALQGCRAGRRGPGAGHAHPAAGQRHRDAARLGDGRAAVRRARAAPPTARSGRSCWPVPGTRSGSPSPGFVLGTVVGIALATVMARFGVVRRGLLPYLVVSQTVPLIALAPLVVSWGGQPAPRRVGVAAVAVGRRPRGLPRLLPGRRRHAARAGVGVGDVARADAQLRRIERQTMRELRFPSAVPFIMPALKLAGAASVIGVVVAEISTGLARRGRPADPRVLAPGDRRPGQGVHGAARRRRCSGWRWPASSSIVDNVVMRNRPRRADVGR